MSSYFIKECRLCNEKQLTEVANFGNVPLGNNLVDSPEYSRKAKTYPLGINRCLSCGHFQLSFSVDPKELYATNYTYLSSIGHSFSIHQSRYVEWLDYETKALTNRFVFEIGSNDGSLLKKFRMKGFKVCGVDPASIASEKANNHGIKTFNEFYSSTTNNKILQVYKRPDLVVSQNVLAHIDNLLEVFENVYELLDFGGFFSFEIGYFLSVFEDNLFDTIYHEHLDYHHANPLVNVLNRIGFSVTSLSKHSVQGGSLRVLCVKRKECINSRLVHQFIKDELHSSIYDDYLIKNWMKRIILNLEDTKKIIVDAHKQGKKIIGYGSPTKAVLLAKLLELDKTIIPYTLEDNDLKVGKFLPLTSIEIKSSDLIKSDKDVKYILIFAWNFSEDIISKIRSKQISNVKAIIPLPELKIIDL